LSSNRRGFYRWFRAAIFISVVVLACVVVGRELSAQEQNVSNPSWSDTSPVFTPAHRTVWGAVAEFFDYRPQAVQPIAFPHNVHIAKGLQCVLCHAGVNQGPDARIPSVKFCMNCHRVIAKDNPEVKKLAAYFAKGEDVPWQRVYGFVPSAHVFFNHAPHIRAGVQCSQCHGDMSKQTVAVRAVNLTMSYCVQCHMERKAPVDCVTCHY
jgi:Cytochrome c7 and related cytochrome c